MNLQLLLDSIHTPHSMAAPSDDGQGVPRELATKSPLTIRAISSHGIRVATPSGDVMTVPWNVMRSLALEGEPYLSLLAEAQQTMLARLKGRRRGAPKPAIPQRRSTDRRFQANVSEADLSLTAPKNDSPATASKATKAMKTSKPETLTLVLNEMPRDLIVKAREKGKSLVPPISLKWAVRLLLEDWVRDGKQR